MFPHREQTRCTLVSTFFSSYLKRNMEKTSEKATKDSKGVEVARKGKEKYINNLKESTLNDAKNVTEILQYKR